MPKFEGCRQAKEISLTRRGANQYADVLVRKNVVTQPGQGAQSEKVMSTEAEKAAAQAEIAKAARGIANKIAGMSEVTKAYYLALDDDKQDAFLAKTADEMKAEAEAAKAAAERAALEEEAAKSGKSADYLELKKSFESQARELEALKAKDADREIEKRAETEFDGFPGGVKAVVPLLKAYAKLDPVAREASENLLKAQAASAKQMAKAFGGRSEQDVSKAEQASARIEKAAKELAAEKKIPYADAWEQVIEKAEFADDVAAIG